LGSPIDHGLLTDASALYDAYSGDGSRVESDMAVAGSPDMAVAGSPDMAVAGSPDMARQGNCPVINASDVHFVDQMQGVDVLVPRHSGFDWFIA
jgi:hypothetical protein